MKPLVPIIIPVCIVLAGCLKEELPVPAHDRGGVTTVQVSLGPGYGQQIWLDLGSGATVASNSKSAWDLAFECAADGWRVMLNGSRLMTAWPSGQTEMTLPTDTTGMHAGRRIDAPSGDPDSTAIGDWRGGNAVFVLDLGYAETGTWLGMRKVRMVSVDATRYTFVTADVDGGNAQTHVAIKDASRSFACFSCTTNGTVPIEPPRGAWDLCFTQYTHQFHDPFLPYLVTGVITDRNTTRVARIPGATFAGVSLADTLAHPFTDARNAIGYDWKTYDFGMSTYTVDPNIVFIVRDADGYFHKLHFIDFYNDLGQAGCPTFELQHL